MAKISREIKVHPSLLTNNLKQNLLNLIIEQTSNECTQKYGYIICVIKITKILSNIVTSANSDIIFNVEFIAETLLPKVGDIMNGIVCLIYDRGIFLKVRNKLKVLIPISCLENYKFQKDVESYYTEKDTNKTIKKNDSLVFEITNIQYSKDNFNCIGKLKLS